MNTIELHIFTNSTINSPSTEIIEQTLKSFEIIFKTKLNATVWCDPNPNLEKSEEYINALKNIFSVVNISSSLSDGYVKSIKQSQSDYLFMLEHDWEFLPSITHSLEEIIFEMNEQGHMYMQFHQHTNNEIIGREELKERARLKELPYKVVPHCFSTHVSNNPHIIDRKKYTENALKYINIRKGSEGIEWELIRSRKITGTIYGPLYHPKTIKHLNGRAA
jgi:hypothetical protein